jgi:ADP-heptose:LPS heptosyltransferase
LRVLLVRAGALGDLLLLRPAVAALRAAGHCVHLLAPASSGGVLCGPGAAESVLALDGPELAAALAEGFREGPVARALDTVDAVVAYTRSEPLLERLAERARRLIIHDPTPPADGPHAARWFAQAIASLVDASVTDSSSVTDSGVLAFTDSEQREAEAHTRGLPGGFLAVHPGSGSPAKNWPLDRFFEAGRRLADGRPWLLVAGPAEEQSVAPPEATLAREWPPRVLGAALARAGLFLGNDSGVSHLAAAAGAPTLALFGPTDPAVWAPVGPRVTALRAPDGSLGGLGLDAVVEAGRRLRSTSATTSSRRVPR